MGDEAINYTFFYQTHIVPSLEHIDKFKSSSNIFIITKFGNTCWGNKKLVSTFSPLYGSTSGFSWTSGFVWFSVSQMALICFSLTKDSGRWGMLLPARFRTASLVMWPNSCGTLQNKLSDRVKIFSIGLNRLISSKLETVLSYTEKSCIVSYYSQFSTNSKMKNHNFNTSFDNLCLWPLRTNKPRNNLTIYLFTIRGKLSIIR